MTENPLDYSFVFEKEGKYNDVWLAATNEKRFNQKNKRNFDQYQITDICKGIETDILHIKDVATHSAKKSSKKPAKKRRRIIQETEETQDTPNENTAPPSFNLKLASNLMMGAVRIWRNQVDQLYKDSKLALSKQTAYNAIVHAQTVEEERRKARINYAEMLEVGNSSTKRGNKKTGNVCTKFTLNDFEQYEDIIVNTNEQNKVFVGLSLNTAQVDQITLREITLLPPSSFTFSGNYESALNDFEPLEQEEVDLFLKENTSQIIDEVRDGPVEAVPDYEMNEIQVEPFQGHSLALQNGSVLDMEQLIDMEIMSPSVITPIDTNFEQQPLIVVEPKAKLQDSDQILTVPKSNKTVQFQDNPKDEYPIPDIQEPTSLDINETPQIEVLVPTEQPEPDDVINLPKLSKKSIKNIKRKVKKGQKRKIDDVLKFTYDDMMQQLNDTSDIVLESTPLPPLKKFKIASPESLMKHYSHIHNGFISEQLTQNFALKVKFLSLNEKTRKRKLNAVLKRDNQEPANKKLRKSDRFQDCPEIETANSNTNVIELIPQEQNPAPIVDPIPLPEGQEEIPQELPLLPQEELPLLPQDLSLNEQPEQFMPGFDNLLNELIEEETPAANHESDQHSVKGLNAMEDCQWKSVKESWGQVGLLKKLIPIFRDKGIDYPTIEMLIEKERTRKVGTVTFTSLIHLKGKKFLELEKNERLEIIRIKQGPKTKHLLSKIAKMH